MASPHFSLKNGSRQTGKSAAAHFQYIVRQTHNQKQDLVYVHHAHYPNWAKENPVEFWKAADLHERANGRTYSEFEIALPRQLSKQQQVALLEGFLEKELGDRHPFTAVIHCPVALDGKPNPHAHVMFSERKLDGIERPEDTFFKRGNKRNPEKGGVAKDRDWNRRGKVRELRKSWEQQANQALDRAGSRVRVNLKSLKAQGIERSPEPKLGTARTAMYRKGIVTDAAREVMQIRVLAAQDKERKQIRNQVTHAKVSLYKERKKANTNEVKASEILRLVKHEKLSIYNEIEALEKAQYQLGGFSRRGEQEIQFNPTKDSFLQQRRDSVVSRYQKLNRDLKEIKTYEKELLLVGDRTLEVYVAKDWTSKNAVVNQKVFERQVAREQEKVREQSLTQEQQLGLRLSLKNDK